MPVCSQGSILSSQVSITLKIDCESFLLSCSLLFSAKPADSVVTRRRLKQQERETREMDLEDMEVSQRADLRRQKREMEERERIRREAKAAPKKPTEDVQSKIRQRAEEERKAFLARIATNRTQIEPPPNTDTIIYPNPMRHPAAASV